jgi:hypothetical protein
MFETTWLAWVLNDWGPIYNNGGRYVYKTMTYHFVKERV